MTIPHDPGQKFVGIEWCLRAWRCGLALSGLFAGSVHAADDEEDKTELLSKDNAELARKYAAVAEWQGFFECSESASISWTGFYSSGTEMVDVSSHGQFHLKRSVHWSDEDVRRGVLTWGGDDNHAVSGEQIVASDRQVTNWRFRGTGEEVRTQAGGTLPMTGTEFSIWLPTLKKNSHLVTVHPGASANGKTIAVTTTGRRVWDESKGNGTDERRTRSLDATAQSNSFVHWFSPTGTAEIAPWFEVVRGGPGVLVFPYEITLRPDSEISSPQITRRSRVILTPVYDDVEVEVTIEGYAKWRPKGSIDNPAKPGNSLIARATLVPKAGADPKHPPKVKNVRFQLLDTSREPGICLNWPLDAKDTDLDLRLAAAPGFTAKLTESDQKNEVVQTLKDQKGRLYAESQINSFDFGGRAILNVVCQLEDGRELLGLIKEGDRTDLARLPKRDGSDWIAESWREAKTVGKLGALTDDDNEPVGDGTKGDGLTLYEEYRGWVENGVHVDGDPKTKDFFIQMVKAPAALPGVGQFQRITGLNVHHKFTEAEFPASRIMNANRDRGPHMTDQHGVMVQVMEPVDENEKDPKKKKDAWPPGVSRAVGGPGNPKMIKSVNLMSDLGDVSAGYAASTVAHELGHCVNLFHHGDDDYKVIWAVINGKLYEGRPDKTVTEILVRNEEGDDCTDVVIEEALAIQGLPKDNRLIYEMGVDQGQHSGGDECVMRYDNARTFVYRTLKQYRFINFMEPVGKVLCTSAEGTGVNDKDRVTMQSRYGRALQDRGDCIHQILVSDAGTSPWRNKGPRLKINP